MVACMRQGLTERGITEIVAVADHISGLSQAGATLLLEPDADQAVEGPNAATVRPPDSADDSRLAALWREIQEREGRRLGLDRLPNFWRLLGHDYLYLRATWRKELVVMAAGELDEEAKQVMALTVAAVNQSRYFTAYYTRILRQRGYNDRQFVRIAAMADHFTCFNRLTTGLDVDRGQQDPSWGRTIPEQASAPDGTRRS
jgi:hypothetical protein